MNIQLRLAAKSKNQYFISRTPSNLKPVARKPLPNFLHSTQLQDFINKKANNENENLIHLLVLLEQREQRLISFLAPQKPCSIREVLGEVGVSFTQETPILVSEAHEYGLDYIVGVGNIPTLLISRLLPLPKDEQSIPQRSVQQDSEAPSVQDVHLKCGEEQVKINKSSLKTSVIRKGMTLTTTSNVRSLPIVTLLKKKKSSKPKTKKCETVVVSSDEDEPQNKLDSRTKTSLVAKEPSLNDVIKISLLAVRDIEETHLEQLRCTFLSCKTIRIGSYHCTSCEPVRIDSNAITLKVPHPEFENDPRVIKIDNKFVAKVLISFETSLPVLFYYLLPYASGLVRNALDMSPNSTYYFDILAGESQKRIALLSEGFSDESKTTLREIYSRNSVFEELTYAEANEILSRCDKEAPKGAKSIPGVQPILIYPSQGKGRITIHTEDYKCLGHDEFLNDVIIDFYLKYLWLNLLKDQQEKVHIFSTFFYKRLTTKPSLMKLEENENDPKLSPVQRRHWRVKTWTKGVNIFEKDFIVIPINERSHWFLAIVCFPSLSGCQTMTGESVDGDFKRREKKKIKDFDVSNKAEEGANGALDLEESSAMVDDEEEPPIKQPCILIFNSLAGTGKGRVTTTIREYLTCEYKAKMNAQKDFTAEVMKGFSPKVPLQTNLTDCGLYLLQYVEQFLKEPLQDYSIPISSLENWFDESVVAKKREDIALLIQSLMIESGKDLSALPDIVLPSQHDELNEKTTREGHSDEEDPNSSSEASQDESDEANSSDESVKTDKLFGKIRAHLSRKKVKPIDFEGICGPQNSDSLITPSTKSANAEKPLELTTVGLEQPKPDVRKFPRQDNLNEGRDTKPIDSDEESDSPMKLSAESAKADEPLQHTTVHSERLKPHITRSSRKGRRSEKVKKLIDSDDGCWPQNSGEVPVNDSSIKSSAGSAEADELFEQTTVSLEGPKSDVDEVTRQDLIEESSPEGDAKPIDSDEDVKLSAESAKADVNSERLKPDISGCSRKRRSAEIDKLVESDDLHSSSGTSEVRLRESPIKPSAQSAKTDKLFQQTTVHLERLKPDVSDQTKGAKRKRRGGSFDSKKLRSSVR